MKKLIYLVILIIGMMSQFEARTQGVAINNDNTAPDASAMLDVKSTTKGLLAPRMTQAQRNAITNPATGLTIYQTDGGPGLYYNAGTPSIPAWSLVGNNAGQWQNNGSSIYYSLGNVGIGTSSPSAGFHVASNSPGYTALFGSDILGYAGATNVSIGNYNGEALLYVGQSLYDKGFLIWNYNPTPANAQFWVGTYNGSNPLLLQPVGGNVGIGNVIPAGLLHVPEVANSFTGIFGTPISTWNASTNVSIGDTDGDAILYMGQGAGNKGFLIWTTTPDPFGAHFSIGTYAGYNPLVLQEAGGNVGIGTNTPASRLEVQYDSYGKTKLGYSNTWTNFIDHIEDPLNGDGQTALYAFRDHLSNNEGTGYSNSTSNSAIEGYSFWGDLYSFGVSGFNYHDFTRCGGPWALMYGGIIGDQWDIRTVVELVMEDISPVGMPVVAKAARQT